MGHRFFEVVFYNDSTSLARASWKIGESAQIDVPRGIDYGTTDKAVLFVGTVDRTLLAIGKVSKVDGANSTFITPDSKTVSFTVVALEAGAEMPTNANIATATCSFLTGSNNSTNFTPAATRVGIVRADYLYTFPAFKMERDDIYYATYIFRGSAGAISFNALTPGIYVNHNGAMAQMRIPSYAYQGGYREITSPLSSKITVTIQNLDDESFKAPIFRFNTDDDNDGLVSFTFTIPVWAISPASVAGQPAALEWYIRPGYGPNAYNLDNGTKGLGGAILIWIGADSNYNLQVTTAPSGLFVAPGW
jgi:hypothetical protein